MGSFPGSWRLSFVLEAIRLHCRLDRRESILLFFPSMQ